MVSPRISGRPVAPITLACGHTMCDPGSAECRTRDALGTTPEQAEQLAAATRAAVDRPCLCPPEADSGRICTSPVCRNNRWSANDLAASLGVPRVVPVDLLDQLIADARAELAHAIGTANRSAPGCSAETVTANWRRIRPGFARLLDLTDRT